MSLASLSKAVNSDSLYSVRKQKKLPRQFILRCWIALEFSSEFWKHCSIFSFFLLFFIFHFYYWESVLIPIFKDNLILPIPVNSRFPLSLLHSCVAVCPVTFLCLVTYNKLSMGLFYRTIFVLQSEKNYLTTFCWSISLLLFLFSFCV